MFVILFCFSDGRLRVGDEIVNVNGQHLRGVQSPNTVQEILTNFIDNIVDLVIAHDELATVGSSSYHGSKLKIESYGSQSDINRRSSSICKEHVPDLIITHIDAGNIETSRRISTTCDPQELENYKTNQISETILRRPTRNSIPQQQPPATHNYSSRKSFPLTPLQNTMDYVPVYANRISISNTISDDEKWQMLSKKRLEILNKNGYSQILGSKRLLLNDELNQKCNDENKMETSSQLPDVRSNRGNNDDDDNEIVTLYRPITFNKLQETISHIEKCENNSDCLDIDDYCNSTNQKRSDSLILPPQRARGLSLDSKKEILPETPVIISSSNETSPTLSPVCGGNAGPTVHRFKTEIILDKLQFKSDQSNAFSVIDEDNIKTGPNQHPTRASFSAQSKC